MAVSLLCLELLDKFEEMNKNIEKSFVKKMEFATQIAIRLLIHCFSYVNIAFLFMNCVHYLKKFIFENDCQILLAQWYKTFWNKVISVSDLWESCQIIRKQCQFPLLSPLCLMITLQLHLLSSESSVNTGTGLFLLVSGGQSMNTNWKISKRALLVLAYM